MALMTKVGGPKAGPMVTFTLDLTNGWTDPAVGNLVKISSNGNYEVAECADGDKPIGVVRVVNVQKDVLTVELFRSPCIVRLPYETAETPNAPDLAEDILAGNAAGLVQGGGAAGVGVTVALDVVSGYADVLF